MADGLETKMKMSNFAKLLWNIIILGVMVPLITMLIPNLDSFWGTVRIVYVIIALLASIFAMVAFSFASKKRQNP